MEQVFSVLPVMPDDQQAYAAHHKYESEKRLIAKKQSKQEATKPVKPNPTPRPRPIIPTKTDNSNSSNNNSEKEQSNMEVKQTILESTVESTPVATEENDAELSDEECTPERLHVILIIITIIINVTKLIYLLLV